MSADFAANGWSAVTRSKAKIVEELKKKNADLKPATITVDDVKIPDTAVARKTYEYAKRELPPKTFNHSMRCYYYGTSYFCPPLVI
jgi:cyanamide hydratase